MPYAVVLSKTGRSSLARARKSAFVNHCGAGTDKSFVPSSLAYSRVRGDLSETQRDERRTEREPVEFIHGIVQYCIEMRLFLFHRIYRVIIFCFYNVYFFSSVTGELQIIRIEVFFIESRLVSKSIDPESAVRQLKFTSHNETRKVFCSSASRLHTVRILLRKFQSLK